MMESRGPLDRGSPESNVERLEEPVEAQDVDFRLPTLELAPAQTRTRESRRAALRWLDGLLENLERANLNECRHPSDGTLRALVEGGLEEPLAYTIPELISIVFDAQHRLMTVNRQDRVGRDDGDDGRGVARGEPKPGDRWAANWRFV
jgi:hypothetical protein